MLGPQQARVCCPPTQLIAWGLQCKRPSGEQARASHGMHYGHDALQAEEQHRSLPAVQ